MRSTIAIIAVLLAAAAVAQPTSKYIRHQPGNRRVIVFVNGIFGDWKSTWENADHFYWPEALTHDHAFDGADVYVHSFNSPKLAKAQDIANLAARFGDFLQTDHVLTDHDQVIFLCHSMGGLVTRALLLQQRIPAAKVPMIYFFATPTGGANVAEIAKKVSKNDQLRDMIPLERNGYLSDQFNLWLRTEDQDLKYPDRIASYCAYELKDTGPVKVVQQLSASLLCNREVREIAENHMGIVKPRNDRDDAYVYFRAAYQRQFGPLQQTIQTLSATRPALNPGQHTATRPPEHPTLTVHHIKAVQYVDVGCAETRTGDVTLTIPIAKRERIIDVTPYFDKTSNLKVQSVALVRHGRNNAVIHYEITGLDKTLAGLNCPGGGNAYIAATFVTERAE